MTSRDKSCGKRRLARDECRAFVLLGVIAFAVWAAFGAAANSLPF